VLRKRSLSKTPALSVFEICAGGGGQALGLEQAGFELAGAAEIEAIACETLRTNRPSWKVLNTDIREIDGTGYHGVDLLAGGVPCPPFSIAGKQLGPEDERDLFPEALRLVAEMNPKAVMLENVRGFASEKFDDYRKRILLRLKRMGYWADWRVLNASDYGVPQLRPRFILVAIKEKYSPLFEWPEAAGPAPTVSETVGDLMLSRGWRGGSWWLEKARAVAPTVVGGSRKHGGPDLGPTRARKQWAELGVDGLGVANEPPDVSYPELKMPKLTVPMVARIQGFPDDWKFAGGKTAAYRQVGNAFPPPVARAVGMKVIDAFYGKRLLKRVG